MSSANPSNARLNSTLSKTLNDTLSHDQLAQCASEPIRIPGAIQPHGWLAVVALRTGQLVAHSQNWLTLLARGSGHLPADLHHDVEDTLRAPIGLRHTLIDGEGPVSCGSIVVGDRPLHVSGHRLGELAYFEVEADGHDAGTRAPIYSLARHLVPKMQKTDSVEQLCREVVQEMKRLTGFGRCLAYRFNEEGHGEVLAEALDPGYDTYAGHRFPAADIPPQARDLYRINHIRLIADANYEPVPVQFVDQRDATSLDLSQAALRSVSPVHLQYMRNMGTLASMSVSIVVGDALWGLVSCHDHAPRHLSWQTRMACEHLGQLLSLQIEAKQENERVTEQLRLRQLTLAIVAHLADSDATLQRLMHEPGPLLRLGRATGAAVILNDNAWSVGEAPDAATLVDLGQWLSTRIDEVVHTDRLPTEAPHLAPALGATTGLLAISISKLHRHYIVWFRPEIVQTIVWAGDPRKEMQVGKDQRLHPRLSFDSWREQVRDRSLPWTQGEVLAVQELRQALIGIVLRRAEELAEVATELGRVNKELEAFSYTVSHDLRAPMRHISGFVDLVLEMDGSGLTDRSRRYLAHVKEASAHAGHLVDALLDFSRMGRAALKPVSIHTDHLVEDLIAEQASQTKDRVIEWTVPRPLPRLWADPVLIQVALRNLIANAVKYTRPRDPARITITPLQTADGIGLSIQDNGVGFQMKYVGKLFGVFQRLHQTESFEGTGIGLASVRRIVERHGGQVEAWGQPDVGARFSLILPTREAASAMASAPAGTPIAQVAFPELSPPGSGASEFPQTAISPD
ncbi:Bacteriophytochrome (light-regulated signal transduction histidine kinase) [Roseateles sp. YR242]|uniref:ATP-binding protein n=1 Tax=Roseateles sp. YR242 TaxID=1855305 RepID=UPI0008ACD2F5|nr:ATP-binding protein [Roseateles sp. YR242]SEL60284.1 Bacteriophytochrome (light-regulated signal transduction histidine kinase) [Roseateles sp. YR242]